MTIKLGLLKSGEEVIADWQEMVVKEQVVVYLLGYPYLVKLQQEDLLTEEPDGPHRYNLSFFPWIPLSKQSDIPVDPNWVVTLVDPIPEVQQSYEDKVDGVKRKREGRSSNDGGKSDSTDTGSDDGSG